MTALTYFYRVISCLFLSCGAETCNSGMSFQQGKYLIVCKLSLICVNSILYGNDLNVQKSRSPKTTWPYISELSVCILEKRFNQYIHWQLVFKESNIFAHLDKHFGRHFKPPLSSTRMPTFLTSLCTSWCGTLTMLLTVLPAVAFLLFLSSWLLVFAFHSILWNNIFCSCLWVGMCSWNSFYRFQLAFQPSFICSESNMVVKATLSSLSRIYGKEFIHFLENFSLIYVFVYSDDLCEVHTFISTCWNEDAFPI